MQPCDIETRRREQSGHDATKADDARDPLHRTHTPSEVRKRLQRRVVLQQLRKLIERRQKRPSTKAKQRAQRAQLIRLFPPHNSNSNIGIPVEIGNEATASHTMQRANHLGTSHMHPHIMHLAPEFVGVEEVRAVIEAAEETK